MSWRKRLKPKERTYKKWVNQGCYTLNGYTRKYNRGLGVRVYYYKYIIADKEVAVFTSRPKTKHAVAYSYREMKKGRCCYHLLEEHY